MNITEKISLRKAFKERNKDAKNVVAIKGNSSYHFLGSCGVLCRELFGSSRISIDMFSDRIIEGFIKKGYIVAIIH